MFVIRFNGSRWSFVIFFIICLKCYCTFSDILDFVTIFGCHSFNIQTVFILSTSSVFICFLPSSREIGKKYQKWKCVTIILSLFECANPTKTPTTQKKKNIKFCKTLQISPVLGMWSIQFSFDMDVFGDTERWLSTDHEGIKIIALLPQNACGNI